jgi:hypothetical protein
VGVSPVDFSPVCLPLLGSQSVFERGHADIVPYLCGAN